MKDRRAALSVILKNKGLGSFAKAVYRAVADIPRGEVRSYKWVASTAGRPLAHRAAGNVLASNPFPVLVPCHRVIRSDGRLGGYVNGAGQKKRLLLAEGFDISGLRGDRAWHPSARKAGARRKG